MSLRPQGPYKPITYGKDFNFYKEVSVTSAIFGGDDGYSATDGYDCNAFIWFQPEAIILLNKSSNIVEYSFNGTTVHGELDGTGTLTKMLTFYHRMQNKIWFRIKSGSSGPATVAVQSWSIP